MFTDESDVRNVSLSRDFNIMLILLNYSALLKFSLVAYLDGKAMMVRQWTSAKSTIPPRSVLDVIVGVMIILEGLPAQTVLMTLRDFDTEPAEVFCSMSK